MARRINGKSVRIDAFITEEIRSDIQKVADAYYDGNYSMATRQLLKYAMQSARFAVDATPQPKTSDARN